MASGEGESSVVGAELEALVGTSRELRRCVEEGDEAGVDQVLKEMLKFVNEIKEDPDLLEPEAAAAIITREQTILTLALTLDKYVKQHSSSSSSAAALGGATTNGHSAPNKLMRAVRVAQIVAEVAKIEVMRELCVECGYVVVAGRDVTLQVKGESRQGPNKLVQ